jgi:hypothetical protein
VWRAYHDTVKKHPLTPHRDILLEVQRLLHFYHGETSLKPQLKPGGMSIDEKMTLWGLSGKEQYDRDEIFEGVEDDEGADFGVPDEAAYNKTIINSQAYSWLISTLQTRMTMNWSSISNKDISSLLTIRNELMRAIPTGLISRKRQPQTHEVLFRIALSAIPWHEASVILPDEEFSLFSRTVVVHGDEPQLTSIKGYVEQLWPGSCIRISGLFRTVAYWVSNRIATSYVTRLADGTQLTAKIHDYGLEIQAAGPSHGIAECGSLLS